MNANVPRYLLSGLSAAPALLPTLTAGLSELQLDFTTGPERFTIREVVAHMADLEEVFLERLQRTVAEDEPFLPDWDEDQAALDNHYAQSALPETLARFTAQRARVLAFLTSLPPDAWHRTSLRQDKRCDLLGMAAILLGHDGYHLKQLVEYRERILGETVS